MEDFIEYGLKYYDKIFEYLLEHIILTFSSVAIGLLITLPISMLIVKSKRATSIILAVTSCIYSIPSMALFAIFMPFFGLGMGTAIFVLVLFCQFVLIRNFVAGFNSVSPAMIEAAEGMGLTPMQIFLKVKLPIALPIIVAGIRLCIISTIASAVIAQTINAGGIGTLIFTGLRTFNTVIMLWGALLATVFALICNYVFEILEKKAYLYSTGNSKVKEKKEKKVK